MKIIFITFGGGNQPYRDSVKRICFQARKFNMFDKIYGFTDDDLRKDEAFWKDHGDFITKNPKGFGYWMWKCYFLKKIMNMDEYKEGDIFFYCDSGCELNVHGKERLVDYIKLTQEHETLAMRLVTFKEKMYTKMDLFTRIGSEEADKDSDQTQGGILFFKKNKINLQLINEMWDIITSDNYHNIDDTPSTIPNDSIFVDHRHDQSCWSLLFKKYKRFSIPDETYFHPDWMKGFKFPIWALRNRTGFACINF
jgi:hypothetical protein